MRAHQDYYAVVGHQVVTLDVDGDQGHERMTIQGDPACPQCGQDAELTVIAKYEGQTANFIQCEGCDAEWRVHYADPPAETWGAWAQCEGCRCEFESTTRRRYISSTHCDDCITREADKDAAALDAHHQRQLDELRGK